MVFRKVSKIQPIGVSFTEIEQPIRSWDILRATNERTLILIGRNPVEMSKKDDQEANQKCPQLISRLSEQGQRQSFQLCYRILKHSFFRKS